MEDAFEGRRMRKSIFYSGLLRNSPQVTSHLCSVMFKAFLWPVGLSPNPSSCHLRHLTIWLQATILGASPTIHCLLRKSSAHHKPSDSLSSQPPGLPTLLHPTPSRSPQAHRPERPSLQTWPWQSLGNKSPLRALPAQSGIINILLSFNFCC